MNESEKYGPSLNEVREERLQRERQAAILARLDDEGLVEEVVKDTHRLHDEEVPCHACEVEEIRREAIKDFRRRVKEA